MIPHAHPYTYPSTPRDRRHGPKGYKQYQRYRPWLEDEFHFRCAYCLKRKAWARTDVWVVDHLVPQAADPHKR